MKLKVFVDFTLPRNVLELLQQGTVGHELIFPQKPMTSVLAKAEWDPQFKSVDIAFGQPDIESITRAENLRWIHVSSSSITRYDSAEFRALMKERNIVVSNSAAVYNEACADHALSFMLAQARQLPLGLKTRAASGTEAWNQLRDSSLPLRGQTVLIVGFGAIGKRLTELLQPFDMNVIAFRRRARGDEGIPVIPEAELPDAFEQADHVMNILPDSLETQKYFVAERFAAMKPGAVFYNIGRGATVDQDALLNALRSGHIKAAWLDVTDPEPLPDDHPLWIQPNCFITPHVAGGHFEESRTLAQHFLKNFRRFVGGEPIFDRVM
ncbi:MAG: D-2-hydroxyacid dehydrogenase [Gammaproteobacteria bacterium]|nr:D-2-hydroxyacid dehydrogenase [Gammaproteobacteria bacterium]